MCQRNTPTQTSPLPLPHISLPWMLGRYGGVRWGCAPTTASVSSVELMRLWQVKPPPRNGCLWPAATWGNWPSSPGVTDPVFTVAGAIPWPPGLYIAQAGPWTGQYSPLFVSGRGGGRQGGIRSMAPPLVFIWGLALSQPSLMSVKFYGHLFLADIRKPWLTTINGEGGRRIRF